MLEIAFDLTQRFGADLDVMFAKGNPADAVPYVTEFLGVVAISELVELARHALDERARAAHFAYNEAFIGGVTVHMLRHAEMPILMAQ